MALAAPALANLVDTTPPEIIGEAGLGAQLLCTSGSWSGETSKFLYEWMREGTPIEFEGHIESEYPRYEMSKADEGHEVWCVVIAEGGGERREAESQESREFGVKEITEKPVNVQAPEVSGGGEVGQALKCSQGTWNGKPTPTYSYRWLREGKEIPGQTSSSYTVVEEDAGHSLACKVIAENSAGEAFALSSNSVEVKGTPPTPVAGHPPQIEGNLAAGELVTCNHGEWSGTKPITYSYEWLAGGSKVSEATGSTFTIPANDEGLELQCGVTAVNGVNPPGSARSASVTVGVKKPENTARPVIEGEERIGGELTCTRGEWTHRPSSYAYRWYSELDGSEEELPSHTERYFVEGGQSGHTLHCDVTAKNSGGEATARSEGFVIPAGGFGEPPATTSRPTISGTAAVHEKLVCNNVRWSGTEPITYEFNWIRDAGSSREISVGTNSPQYEVQGADEGHTLTCEITAANEHGVGRASSEPFSVLGRAPVDTAPPYISGEARVGETLTCVAGIWEGAEPIAYSYRWERDGTPTRIETDVYKVSGEDSGHTLTCVVKATNMVGEKEVGEAQASASVKVPGGAPEAVEAPSIKGTPAVNEELICEEGRWNGVPLTPSFEWLLNGVAIPGAIGKNLTVTTAYRGLQLACRVTETNSEGQASAESGAVRVAGVPPKNAAAPLVTGGGYVGSSLTCEHGLWQGAPPPTFAYRWYREGVQISGAAGSTYSVQTADQGHLIACTVIATNVQGQAEAESANGVPITAPSEEIGTRGYTTSSKPHTSVAAVHNAFLSQLPSIFAAARLKHVRMLGGLSIPFTAVGAGALELEWYVETKAPHGKHVRVVLARGAASYTRAERLTVHLTLTREGKRRLKRVRRIKLDAEARFSILGGAAVTWTESFTLH
jgi:hypothetical protein